MAKKEQPQEEVYYDNKFKVNLSVEAEADQYFHVYEKANNFIYKYCICCIAAIFIFIVMTVMILFLRDDSRFYLSTPEGKVVEVDTRLTPQGSFKVSQYKD